MTPQPGKTAAKRLLGPGLSLKELNLICWGLFAGFLVIPLSFVLIVRGGATRAGGPEVDFVYLYSMGRMLNQYPPADLYNYDLEKQVCQEVHPLQKGEYGPIPYAPYIGVLFRPFALLSYTAAYMLWVSISFLLYLAGVTLVSSRFFAGDPLRRSLVYCFALSYYPFINWTLLSGHISTIGFLAFAVAFHQEDVKRPFWSGMALSICHYKPPLLLLFLPMLVVSKRFRTIAGFCTGGLAVALFTTAVEGFGIWSGYFRMLLSFGRGAATVQGHSFKQLWKYVDISSFLDALHGPAFWAGALFAAACAVWAAFHLLRFWWKSPKPGTLLWAATLTWSLVLNIYTPIYDSILMTISVITTAGVLRRHSKPSLQAPFTLLWLAIIAGSWFTLGIAESSGFQLLTVLFCLFGLLQLAILRREKVS